MAKRKNNIDFDSPQAHLDFADPINLLIEETILEVEARGTYEGWNYSIWKDCHYAQNSVDKWMGDTHYRELFQVAYDIYQKALYGKVVYEPRPISKHRQLAHETKPLENAFERRHLRKKHVESPEHRN